MIESQLLLLIKFLNLLKEDHPALVIAAVYALYEPATFQNSLIIPLDFEHSPVLLDVNCRCTFLLTPFLGLTRESLDKNFEERLT